MFLVPFPVVVVAAVVVVVHLTRAVLGIVAGVFVIVIGGRLVE